MADEWSDKERGALIIFIDYTLHSHMMYLLLRFRGISVVAMAGQKLIDTIASKIGIEIPKAIDSNEETENAEEAKNTEEARSSGEEVHLLVEIDLSTRSTSRTLVGDETEYPNKPESDEDEGCEYTQWLRRYWQGAAHSIGVHMFANLFYLIQKKRGKHVKFGYFYGLDPSGILFYQIFHRLRDIESEFFRMDKRYVHNLFIIITSIKEDYSNYIAMAHYTIYVNAPYEDCEKKSFWSSATEKFFGKTEPESESDADSDAGSDPESDAEGNVPQLNKNEDACNEKGGHQLAIDYFYSSLSDDVSFLAYRYDDECKLVPQEPIRFGIHNTQPIKNKYPDDVGVYFMRLEKCHPHGLRNVNDISIKDHLPQNCVRHKKHEYAFWWTFLAPRDKFFHYYRFMTPISYPDKLGSSSAEEPAQPATVPPAEDNVVA